MLEDHCYTALPSLLGSEGLKFSELSFIFPSLAALSRISFLQALIFLRRFRPVVRDFA